MLSYETARIFGQELTFLNTIPVI